MSALRKAGVWLGLVEDDGDAAYDDRDLAPGGRDRSRRRPRDTGRRYDDDYDDEEEPEGRGRGDRPTERIAPSERQVGRRGAQAGGRRPVDPGGPGGSDSPGGAGGATARRGERGAGDQRASVHSITRDSTVSYLTRDNLALAPEVEPVAPPVNAGHDDRRYQITTLHPTTYREARTIGEHFREGTPVIMNLTEMEEADARRLVDFGAGLAIGLRGTMERVTNRVFLLLPANVHVTAEDRAKIAEGEFFHHR